VGERVPSGWGRGVESSLPGSSGLLIYLHSYMMPVLRNTVTVL